MEGIFRLAGSEKRIKELKVAFDSPDRYGKGLDWTGYTVHDAANILRRYFNQLPEPIIPLEFYQRFREPLRGYQELPDASNEGHISSNLDVEAAIKTYQGLITELPPLNRQLLLYILDLLAVFASKSDLNKMTTPNLAAIFQPGILNHPQHDMAPKEYRLSQDILIFLIENQDSFLIGMQGTAADADTLQNVQNGSPRAPSTPPTPNRSRTVINRSGSNSSAAAESVRRFGSLRRNLSVSSRHSKRSEGTSPSVTATPVPAAGGVHRSNTVPSRRAGSTTASPRFQRDGASGTSSPSPAVTAATATGAAAVAANESNRPASTIAQPSSIQNTPVPASSATFASVAPPEVTSATSSEVTTSMATGSHEAPTVVTKDFQTPKKDSTPLLMPQPGSAEKSGERSVSNTPSLTTGRKFLDILKQSPTGDGETRKPNKLQKKRIPGSSLSSAQSSSQSLSEVISDTAPRSPISPRLPPIINNALVTEFKEDTAATPTAQTMPVAATPQRQPTEATIRPNLSPSNSFCSQTGDETSDADMVGDDMPAQGEQQVKEKKRGLWRLSRANNKVPSPPTQQATLSTMTAKDLATSRSTIGSTIGSSAPSQPRKSFQEPTPLSSATTDPTLTTSSGTKSQSTQSSTVNNDQLVFSDSEREKKGPMSWIRGKIQERKDNKEIEKRSRTPDRNHERSKSNLQLSPPDILPANGKPVEQQQPSTAVSPPLAAAAAPVEAASVAPVSAPVTKLEEASVAPSTSQPPAETTANKSEPSVTSASADTTWQTSPPPAVTSPGGSTTGPVLAKPDLSKFTTTWQ